MKMDGVSGECGEVTSLSKFSTFISEHSMLIVEREQVNGTK